VIAPLVPTVYTPSLTTAAQVKGASLAASPSARLYKRYRQLQPALQVHSHRWLAGQDRE